VVSIEQKVGCVLAGQSISQQMVGFNGVLLIRAERNRESAVVSPHRVERSR
jgi:hypothetical protein